MAAREGGQGLGKVLEILGETLVASEPGKGALDHPTARQDDEALRAVAPLDDRRSSGTSATAAATCQAL
jgi:hypothetical protein